MIELYVGIVATVALALGLVSRWFRDLPLSEPLVALAVGAALGPSALGVLAMPAGRAPEMLRVAAELALALAVMSAALRFTSRTLRAELAPLAVLLGIVLPAMALMCAAVGLAVLPVSAAAAWLLGAAVAPTDPVLAASVVSGEPAGRDVPERLRVQLSTESAANDGLAFALVAVGTWAVEGSSLTATLVSAGWRLVLGLVLGVVAGIVVGRLLRLVERNHGIEHSSFLVLTVLLALAVLGIVHALGGQALVAVFAAGVAYNRQVSGADRRSEWEIEEAMNRYLTLPVFVILGTALPWAQWGELDWKAPLFVAGVLVLRRMPVIFAVRRLLRLGVAEAAFLGWFGPIGVAAILYLSEGFEQGVVEPGEWALGILVVTVSTVVHGVTGTVGRRRLAQSGT